MKLLELNNVSIRFGHKFVVKDVSWEIQEGENWAFLGLNGCGKTTLRWTPSKDVVLLENVY